MISHLTEELRHFEILHYGKLLEQLELTLTLIFWDVVGVKWSAYSPTTLMIQVRIPLKPTIFSVNFLVKMRPGFAHF